MCLCSFYDFFFFFFFLPFNYMYITNFMWLLYFKTLFLSINPHLNQVILISSFFYCSFFLVIFLEMYFFCRVLLNTCSWYQSFALCCFASHGHGTLPFRLPIISPHAVLLIMVMIAGFFFLPLLSWLVMHTI